MGRGGGWDRRAHAPAAPTLPHHPATPSQIYICRSGSAADTQNIAAHATWYLEAHTVELGRAPRVPAAARLLSQMTYANKDALQAGLIVAGWDGVDGGQVYAVPLGGTVVKVWGVPGRPGVCLGLGRGAHACPAACAHLSHAHPLRPCQVPFAVGGSGSAYVTGLCDKLWRPGMTRDECVAFVRRVVAHAVARDGSSGGCIRTVAITKDGADRQFVAGDAVPPTFGDLAPPARGPAPIAVD